MTNVCFAVACYYRGFPGIGLHLNAVFRQLTEIHYC